MSFTIFSASQVVVHTAPGKCHNKEKSNRMRKQNIMNDYDRNNTSSVS